MSDYLLYFAFISAALVALAILANVIHKMGQALAICPKTGTAAKAGSLVVVTGFVVVGIGGISLVSAALPYIHDRADTAVLMAFGFVVIGLGIGFSQAAATLQKIVGRALIDINVLPPAPISK